MKHVSLQQPGTFAFGESSDPEGGGNSAIVRVHRIGVCGTDIHAFHGRQPFFEYPRILGHELGVEVVEAPSGSGLSPGDTCAVVPYLNDPESQASRRGKTNCCEELQVLGVHTDGGMRPYLCLPADKLLKSEAMSLDQLALVETLCIGAHATARSEAGEDDFVAILGAGPIGLTVLEFVRHRTRLPVVVLDVNETRLRFVREEMGIEHTLNLTDVDDPAAALREIGAGDLPTMLFDATGNPQSMMGTFDLIAHGGTIVFVGLFQGDVVFNDPNFHRRELTLKSSRNGTAADFRTVMSAIEAGRVDTRRWLTHRMKFDQVPDEFANVIADPGLLKAIIEV